jgi:hypothetical protein
MSIYNFEKLTSFCDNNNIELVKDFSVQKINARTPIEGKCIFYDKCQNIFKKSFICLIEYGAYCKKCINILRYDKIKQTCLNKYGCENIFSNENIKEKIKNTNLQKYGSSCYLTSDEGKAKSIQIIRDKYGVDNISQSNIIKNKKKETCLKNFGVEYSSQNNIVKNKIKETNNIKYGFDYGFKNNIIKSKIKNTCLKKYGVEYIGQNDIIKNKIKETNYIKYDVECILQNKKIKEQIINTNLIKYGVENPIQNPEIADKAANNSYQVKTYTLPSGKIIKYQGYENFALDELINSNICENDIYNKKIDVPEIWYCDDKGKNRRHYVDIYIKSQNKCIEVKSNWYFNCSKDIILNKQKAAKKLGYNYEIWVYDNKRNKVIYE